MEPVAPALADHKEGGRWPRSLPAQEIVGAAVLAGLTALFFYVFVL
jgi:hypothetical protein